MALAAEGRLAEQMARRFGLHDKADVAAAVAICVALHNEDRLDLLQLVEAGSLQALEGSSFFMATNFLCRTLPDLEAPIARVMACVDALVVRGGADGAANQPNGAFRTWCARDRGRAAAVVAAARGGDALATKHLTFALEAMNDLDEARRIALEFDDERRLGAITALGRLAHPDAEASEATFSVFGTVLQAASDDKVCASLLHAICAIAARSGEVASASVVGLARRICEMPGEHTLHQAAHVLWGYREVMRSDLVEVLLSALAAVDPKNKGTINELDLGLQALLENGQGNEAVAFISGLLAESEKDLGLDDFSSFVGGLLDGPPERLSQVVVAWLQLGAGQLCEGLAAALRHRDRGEARLDLRPEHLAIGPAAQIFICRKAIGYFFLQPVTAASVLVSVLAVAAPETATVVEALLVEPLLLNYGGVRAYLEALPAAHPAKTRVEAALAANEAYLAALRAIPDVKELQPAEHQRRIERLRMSDEMRAAHKQAQSESVFLNLVRRSTLLYGNRSLSFIRDDDETLRSMEMDLHPMGVSFEFPRMEIVDPVGLDYLLRVFRVERMAP